LVPSFFGESIPSNPDEGLKPAETSEDVPYVPEGINVVVDSYGRGKNS
jgi:hypothetical protein